MTLEQRLKDIFESFRREGPSDVYISGTRAVSPVAKSGVLFSTGERSEPGLATSFSLKSEIEQLQEKLNNAFPALKKKSNTLTSSQDYLTKKLGEKKNQKKTVEKNLAEAQSLTTKEQKFYELANKGLTKAQEAKTTYGVLLRREAELDESEEYVRLKAEELKHFSQSHWSMPKEIALYLFGFKWLWGAFTGYQPTVNTSRIQKELKRLRSAHRSLALRLKPQIKRLKAEFEKQKTQALEFFRLAELAAPSSRDKQVLLHFSQTFLALFGEYELRVQNFMAAKAVFVQAQYNS